MKKFLFVVLLLSLIKCATLAERINGYCNEIKRKAKEVYGSAGRVEEIRASMHKHLSPVGERLKTHSKDIISKISNFGKGTAIPKVKKMYQHVKDQINKEKEKAQAKMHENKEKEAAQAKESEFPEAAPSEDPEEVKKRMKEIEEFIKMLVNDLQEKGAGNATQEEDEELLSEEEKELGSDSAKDETGDGDNVHEEYVKSDL
ncbi:uncharacterized protein NEMAJ01_0969 [Nematocida major]|uniref:uncharacterized protein n=1 Tax=Nematocida major TaxID=1912982 RepID=UPI0020089519|nr:uncharacterized protein NEMAJ01_0969 [Nematocida major]KAH9386073.1 hypothetical protein NEMAJ01_0969 [Nematocida major]